MFFSLLSVNQLWLTDKKFSDILVSQNKGGNCMAVKIRLKRGGSKQRPFYRIVAADSRSPRDGRFIDTIGTYNPIPTEYEVSIDEEKALYWLSKGAEPTDTVKNLLSKQGIIKKHTESKKEGK